MKLSILTASVLAAASLAMTALPASADQGVTDNEIVIGHLASFSGPLSGPGKQIRDGMLMRTKEVNDAGGIHGRKIKIIFEDVAYDPKKSALAAQKLVNRDHVFAIAGSPGTVVNTAAFPVMFPKKVLSFMPIASSRVLFEEPNMRYKFSILSTYYSQAKDWAGPLATAKGSEKVCGIMQDDEMGQEIRKGVVDSFAEIDMEPTEMTTFKRGTTDFTTQVQRVAAKGCDFVAIGAVIRETIGIMQAAERLGYDPVFFGVTPSYSELIPKLGGEAVNGLYAAYAVPIPYSDAESEKVRDWFAKFEQEYSEEPGVYNMYGYVLMDIFSEAAEMAGPDLSTDSFIDAMETLKWTSDIFADIPEMTWPADDRVGTTQTRLSEVVDGRYMRIELEDL